MGGGGEAAEQRGGGGGPLRGLGGGLSETDTLRSQNTPLSPPLRIPERFVAFGLATFLSGSKESIDQTVGARTLLCPRR